MKVVLDASAVLAFLQDEPGSDTVETEIAHSFISSVNWSEVVQKSINCGVEITGMREDMQVLGLTVVPFSAQDAELAAHLWQHTRHRGLSLADRACLGVAQRLELPVFTTDRMWAELGLPLDIRIVR